MLSNATTCRTPVIAGFDFDQLLIFDVCEACLLLFNTV